MSARDRMRELHLRPAVAGPLGVPMSLLIRCACSRTLPILPEWVGKNVRCPGCGAVLHIQQQAVAPSVSPPPPPVAPPVARPVPPPPPAEKPPARHRRQANRSLSPKVLLCISGAVALVILLL